MIPDYSHLTFKSSVVTKLVETPEHVAIDGVCFTHRPEHFIYDRDSGVVTVKDDMGREVAYTVDRETSQLIYGTLIRDYAPNRDEADFIDDTAEDCVCADCAEAVPTEDGIDWTDVYEYGTPGLLEVVLTNNTRMRLSNVVRYSEYDGRLYVVELGEILTVITAPFIAYTVFDPSALENGEDEGNDDLVFEGSADTYDSKCPAEAAAEPEFDRDGLEALRTKIAEENQRKAVEAVLNRQVHDSNSYLFINGQLVGAVKFNWPTAA